MAAETPIQQRPRHRSWLIAIVLVLVALAAWYWYHREHDKPPVQAKTQPVQVTSTRVKEQSVPLYRTGIGTVAAMASVTVKARVDGQLDQVFFTEGQDVKAGQLLAQLDPRTLAAQLQQVQAQKGRDQAQLANANNDLRRYTGLIAQDAATQQQVDTQKALVAQLDAAVKTDDAQINYAQVQLGFTRIAAPISGRVGARLVDAGNIVHAADANGLVVINQIDPINVVFTLPEDAFGDINSALRKSTEPLGVVLYPRNGNEVLGRGQLVLVNNQIDTTSGTIQMKGRFANASHSLWPGQYVNVRLVLGHDEHALTVPATAVQRSQDGTYLYVVKDDNTAQIVPVKVGPIEDGIAVIQSGVKAGDRVVVDGQYKLKPGIAVVEAAPAGARAASGAARGASAAGAGPSPQPSPASGRGSNAGPPLPLAGEGRGEGGRASSAPSASTSAP